MPLAIPFPDLDPEIFAIPIGDFHFALRWYAMAYIVGIVVGWKITAALMRRPRLWPGNTAPLTPGQVEDLVTGIVLGIILGGRLGFVLFYQPAYYLAHPVEILYVWQGGMSFHGGMLGVVCGIIWTARKYHAPILQVGDALALAVPPGLLFGRLANFVNAELWGRPTDLPWGVVFPGPAAQDCPGVAGLCARHPSQLYEAGLEGLVLGGVLLWLGFARGGLRRSGQMTGVFLAGYALARIIVELFRQADPQFISETNPWGYVLRIGETGLSMGQLLSLPMLAAGLALLVRARSRRPVSA